MARQGGATGVVRPAAGVRQRTDARRTIIYHLSQSRFEERAHMSRHIGKLKWASYAVIAVSLVLLIRALPLSDGISALRSWVEGLGVWGPIVFGLIYVAAVVGMIPASLLTLAAGATFGLLVGTITVVIAANVGAALALLIARYLAREQSRTIRSDSVPALPPLMRRSATEAGRSSPCCGSRRRFRSTCRTTCTG